MMLTTHLTLFWRSGPKAESSDQSWLEFETTNLDPLGFFGQVLAFYVGFPTFNTQAQ